MKREIGYVRIGTEKMSPHAVQWWYFWAYEDGWSFARGGRCRTIREARRLIRNCHALRERERQQFLDRPQFVMKKDGSLIEINRGWLDIVPNRDAHTV